MAIKKKQRKKAIVLRRVLSMVLGIVGWKIVVVGIFKVIMMEFTKIIDLNVNVTKAIRIIAEFKIHFKSDLRSNINYILLLSFNSWFIFLLIYKIHIHHTLVFNMYLTPVFTVILVFNEEISALRYIYPSRL